MAKIRINGQHEFEGSEVRVKDGVLYIDGNFAMDFPDQKLNVESDGSVSVSADIPVSSKTSSTSSTSSGRSRSSIHTSSSSSGPGAKDHAQTADEIIDEVQQRVGGIGEQIKKSLGKAMPPGFPFHKKK